jgi:predicted DsbA family dithiol-disulfide isomerase
MLKLLSTTLLLSSTLLVASTQQDVEEFLKDKFKQNRGIIKLDVKVLDKSPVEELKGWEAYIIRLNATVKDKGGSREASQKMIWFSNGTVISPDLFDMDTGESLKDNFPFFEQSYYKKENLIYGNENAKHKVAIFSDPLCPFCRMYVPKAIEDMKKQPNKFALYYYHMPLPRLHPAAVELSKAAIAAEHKGVKDVVLKLYKIEIDSKERDVNKILAVFNKTMGTNIKPSDLNDDSVVKQYESDQAISDAVMVEGTPTVFFDGKKDNTKNKYKKVK